MKLYDVKAGGARRDAGAGAVTRFFEDLAAGRTRRAGARCTDPMRWFGRVVTREEWGGEAFRGYLAAAPLTFEAVRAFPREVWSALGVSPESLFEGPMQERDEVFMVDVTRQGPAVTVGVVVRAEGAGHVVARVFDPEALQRAAARPLEDGE